AAQGIHQLQRAVSDAADVFGPSSRMVGFYSLPLAALQIETGQVEAAIRNSEAGVAIIARHSDPTSFRYANALFHRGTAWLPARQPQKAPADIYSCTVHFTR